MKKILVVDDDMSMLDLVRFLLEKYSFQVFTADSYNRAIEIVDKVDIDAAILDIVLPDKSGFSLLQYIRTKTASRHIPIIMLTGRTDEIDTILGLEMGADDYIYKPFRKRELIARLNVLFRRIEMDKANSGRRIVHGLLSIDLEAKRVFHADKELHLSPKEFELLVLLARFPDRVFERDEILDRLWNEEVAYDQRTVDVYIRRIRDHFRKQGIEEGCIETIRGYGYRFHSVES